MLRCNVRGEVMPKARGLAIPLYSLFSLASVSY
ncbi:hypothetical protein GGE16_003131 [Rhizobium leguminosarum]|uniref:Uncharacterized protein n=1 Tax=Rhizobium leguminosarum TaxID=384 RepID=A0AAE2SWT5_RHILE|nr:hypothetical protein [Rhizobium leguminosarum]MBB4430223.1 hypothetical protein [Rhizobium esperanzae]MBB4297832.1 hypothetical protein [Rhizobium leguminosarum]MBB4308971.1 hypothetical protein [Rhizobium leguminosarum]MBB4416808.1 hypothetical protein [Rhizobium leguminosarum]